MLPFAMMNASDIGDLVIDAHPLSEKPEGGFKKYPCLVEVTSEHDPSRNIELEFVKEENIRA